MESMVQRVVRQAQEANLTNDITLATNASQLDIIQNQLGERVSVVTEPERRDTFPAIALAASYLKLKKECEDDEVVVIMPCDPYTELEYFHTIARMASGTSGAELANIVNEAALRAVRDGRASATQADLEESIEVVIAGYQKKNSILTDHEKCIVAYHEIGHALVAAKQSNSAPVQKITIIPRTSGALGYTMQVDEGNHYLMNKAELENKIATLTGGRAAEEVAFNSITTGASNDIEQATKLARAMLTRYGMSDEFDMVALETVNNQYLGGDTSLACSAQTQREIDQKVVELVKTQHEKAIRILTENRAKLDELAQYLYQKETITGEEFMDILNRDDTENKPENP